MIARKLVRLASRVPGIPGELADWYDEMHEIAEQARRQRIEDEGRDERDKHDMARWLREPDQRRPAPRNGGRS